MPRLGDVKALIQRAKGVLSMKAACLARPLELRGR